MSYSNDCSNASVMPNDDLDENSILDFYTKSNIFYIDKHSMVQPELNRVIAKLTNPKKFSYTTNITKIIRVLRDKEIVGNQQNLMQLAIDNISEDTVDVDYIKVGIKLSKSDQDKLLSKRSDLFGIQNIKTNPRKERLNISKVKIGDINYGFKSDGKSCFFSHKFLMCVDNDIYRYIHVYIADPAHPKNKGRKLAYNCVIEFIPTRVSNQQVSFMLYQFYSLLGPRRYEQLIRNAKLLELHTGTVMYGVSQLFAFLLTDNNKVKNGYCYPEEPELAAESTYAGKLSSDHSYGYDKTLKETKKFFERTLKGWGSTLEPVAKALSGIRQLFTEQVCSYRLESKRRFYKKFKKLTDMCSVKSGLRDIKLLKPCYLQELSDTELKRLINDKSLNPLSDICDQLFLRTNGKYLYLSFDTKLLDSAIKRRLSLLLGAIREPEKGLDEYPSVNDQALVSTVRKIIKPMIKASRNESDPVNKIVRSKKRAIYIEGCPGSGKTRLIVKRVRYLLSQGVEASQISVLAFTNEAAAEFKRRLKEKGLYDTRMFVGTFSGWCNQLLDATQKLDVLNRDAAVDELQSVIDKDCKMAKAFALDDIARRCFDVFSYMANYDTPILNNCIKKVAPDLVCYQNDILALHKAYIVHKKGKFRDFNDMLSMLRTRIAEEEFCSSILKKTKHLIIDEIQDTNIVQWNIIKGLYRKGINFFCVGDPAQSMYGFRGAKSGYLDKFSGLFANSKCFKLTDNHRSTEPLVELANVIREKINRNYSISFPVKDSETACRPRIKSCDYLKEAVSWLINDLQESHTTTSHLILCRYKNQCKRVEEALDEARILHGKKKAIQVYTYHKGKGLEAEHCYVLDPQFSKSKLSSYKEELCNAYVALTRAKESLTILACNSGSSVYGLDNKQGKRAGKSIFLDLPEELLEFVD